MQRTAICHAVQAVVIGLIVALEVPLSAEDASPPKDLTSLDIEDLLNVEISVASKKPEPMLDAPGVVVVVPREESVVYGDRTLHQLMQRQPSVYTRDTFTYADNLAAFRGDMSTLAEMHTLILYNGRPIRESAQGINVNLYRAFPLANLESVELIRGPGSVLYGSNAFTGVVNLKSRPVPEQTQVSVSGMGGSFGYYDTTVSLGGRAGDLGFVTDLRAAGEDGFRYHMVDAAGVYGEEDKSDKSLAAAGHLEYRGFTFDFFGSDIDAFALGVLPFWSNPHHTISDKKVFANAGYRLPVHDRATLEFNATYNLQENGLSGPRPLIIGTNTSDLLGEVTLFTNPLDNANVVLGFLQEYRSNYPPGDDYFQSIPSYRYYPRSAYAQGDYKVGRAVKLIAGTQWNESSQHYADFVSRYGVILTPLKRWGLKLLRGEAFRAPVTLETDLYDPTGLVGNSAVKPETVTTYDAQLFYHDEKTHAAVTYFHSLIDRLIIYDASVVPMSYMNGGQQTFQGIELEGKRFLTPHWRLLGSFTHQQNETDAGLNPSVVPENMVKVGTDYTWDWGSAAIFCSFYGMPPRIVSPLVVNPQPEPLNLISANLRADLCHWLDIKKGRAILDVKVENILNEEVYAPTFAYIGVPNSFPYGPGITFFAGLTVNF